MQIRITKKERRSVLTCIRADGSSTSADLGPGLPAHDLAHFVVERAFHLEHGFFGNVRSGYSLQALGQTEVIQRLGREALRAEVLARALGSLATGACAPEQFGELINTELISHGIPPLAAPEPHAIALLLRELRELLDRYNSLPNGESLALAFN